jgi:ribosome-associated heat shock protein Hsp15
MTGIRIDKWLWAARFFKTRALASHACDLGRIQSNGQQAKPAREVHPGDRLQIRNEGGDYVVEILTVSDIRGPAALAQTLYRESDESRELRLRLAQERKAMMAAGELPASKPSKRDRRQIHRFRDSSR